MRAHRCVAFCERTSRAPKPKPYPKQLNTLGDRLLAYRLDCAILRREVARRIGVTTKTLGNWERNKTKAEVRYYPRILAVVGDEPIVPSPSLGETCKAVRRKLGLSAQGLAFLIGVDEATMRRFEADNAHMARRTIAKIVKYLETAL